MIDLLYPFYNLNKLATSIIIMLGLWAISKLFWMVVYEYRWKGAGDDYLRYGKEFTKTKYLQKVYEGIYTQDETNRKIQIENASNKR